MSKIRSSAEYLIGMGSDEDAARMAEISLILLDALEYYADEDNFLDGIDPDEAIDAIARAEQV